MPFGAVAVALTLLATLFAVVGHCNSDQKTLVACGLYTLGGLSLAGGLVVFASVLSDVYLENPRRYNVITSIINKHKTQLTFDYRYGWSFFAAGAAFIMAEVAALISITAYVRRFPTVEDMVRVMVPGAERKLRQHYLHNDFIIKRTGCHMKPEPIHKSEIPKKLDGCDDPMIPNKTPPDICTTNNKKMVDASAGDYPNLAGTTVPITLMHHKPVPQFGNHVNSGHPTTLLFPHQDYRYATIGPCTLVYQGVLGVSEGVPGTSSSSGSSASSGGMLTSTGSSASSRSFHHVPRKTAINSGFMTIDSTQRLENIVSPSSGSQGYCSSGSVV